LAISPIEFSSLNFFSFHPLGASNAIGKAGTTIRYSYLHCSEDARQTKQLPMCRREIPGIVSSDPYPQTRILRSHSRERKVATPSAGRRSLANECLHISNRTADSFGHETANMYIRFYCLRTEQNSQY
jgi:hypothetical protein